MAYSITPTVPDIDNAQVGSDGTATLGQETSTALHSAYARITANVGGMEWPDSTCTSNGAKAVRCRWPVPIPSDGPREVTLRVMGKNSAGTGGIVHFESYASIIGAATDTGTAVFNGGVGTTQSSDITIDLPTGQDVAFVRMFLQSDANNAANIVEVYRTDILVEPLTSVVAVGNAGVRMHGGGTFAPMRTTAANYPYTATEIHAKVRTARGLLKLPRMLTSWAGIDDSRNSSILTPRPRTATRQDARITIVPPVVYDPIPGAVDESITLYYYAEGGAATTTIRPYALTFGGVQRFNASAVSVASAAAGAWYTTTIPLPTTRGTALPRLIVNLGLDGIDPADCAVSSYGAWAV